MKIKICGISRPEDTDILNRYLPDYTGFVFAAGSKRQVTEKQAAILRALLDPLIQTVGVFVNENRQKIAGLAENHTIQAVQLHGDEDAGYIKALKEILPPNVSIIKALRVQAGLPAYPGNADMLLFDTYAAEAYGGTGQGFDTGLLAGFVGKPYFLAGGLTPENLTQKVQGLQPYAVDVSSGVETNGIKDQEKIKRFIQAVRAHKEQIG